ncbi:hypothetical protein, partial [Chryseobacterium caseinilyticum]|uniref:hypothetical protein n=1 Tax=Chryseobacterium caseinilyticum TaxID=2771428 RepID=UPI001E598AFE
FFHSFVMFLIKRFNPLLLPESPNLWEGAFLLIFFGQAELACFLFHWFWLVILIRCDWVPVFILNRGISDAIPNCSENRAFMIH